jgi:hypothetical protein
MSTLQDCVDGFSAESTTEHRSNLRRRRKLNELLLNAVDETLKQVFKEEGTHIIFQYLEGKCHYNCKTIAKKPDEFTAALNKLIGSATPVIEKMILKNLFFKLKLKFEENQGYKFSDYLTELREKSGC